jgi:hypothetical protein
MEITMLTLLAAQSSTDGGVNILPIALVVFAAIVGVIVWRRRSR